MSMRDKPRRRFGGVVGAQRSVGACGSSSADAYWSSSSDSTGKALIATSARATRDRSVIGSVNFQVTEMCGILRAELIRLTRTAPGGVARRSRALFGRFPRSLMSLAFFALALLLAPPVCSLQLWGGPRGRPRPPKPPEKPRGVYRLFTDGGVSRVLVTDVPPLESPVPPAEPAEEELVDVLTVVEKNEKLNEAIPDEVIQQASQLLSFDNRFYNVDSKLVMYEEYSVIARKIWSEEHKLYGVN